MNSSLRLKLLRGSVAVLLLASRVGASLGQDGSFPPLIEVQSRFFRVTTSQREEAFKAAGVGQSASVLTPEQFKTMMAALKNERITSFSEQRIVTQSGKESDAQAVEEFRYPTKYEPSTKTPGKSVAVAFAMRLVGVTLDVLPTVTSNGDVELRATPMFNKFLGFIEDIGKASKDTPSLQDRLKAPLQAGTVWRPVFSTYTETQNFYLKDGETAVMAGWPSVEIQSPDHEILVSLTVHKIGRDQEVRANP